MNRLDGKNLPGTLDTGDYYGMVAGSRRDVEPLMASRILVVSVARPIARVASGHLGSWDPIWFGLLVANSFFCATAGYVLLLIGIEVMRDAGLAWIGVLTYLLSFSFTNRLLIGFIDSAEACVILLVVWAMLNGRWVLLPILGAAGALAKESFVPIATAMAVAWYVTELRECKQRTLRWRKLMYVALMGIAGVVVVTALQSSLAGRLVTPWKFAASLHHEGYLSGLMECFAAREFWYTLGWPLALGIWRLRDFPRPWLWASGAGVVIALILGAWNRAGGNTAPAMFDAAGALLCVSTADLLCGCVSRLDTRGG